MIENDPTLPEVELLETLKAGCKNFKVWTILESKKFLEAYELWGWDYSAISQHVQTKSKDQVENKRHQLVANMKSNPAMPMSHFFHTDLKVRRQKARWTVSEESKFNDAVRKVGYKPYQICSMVGSKTYVQVIGHIYKLRRLFQKDPASPNADVGKILTE